MTLVISFHIRFESMVFVFLPTYSVNVKYVHRYRKRWLGLREIMHDFLALTLLFTFTQWTWWVGVLVWVKRLIKCKQINGVPWFWQTAGADTMQTVARSWHGGCSFRDVILLHNSNFSQVTHLFVVNFFHTVQQLDMNLCNFPNLSI